ncbi:MAG: hypothetical protein HOP11_07905 [Saprospiraceae bacterium]|nr:hypothetical protein [Saprospiraceae bacterium]
MFYIITYNINLSAQNLAINPSLEGDSCDISDFNNNGGVDLPDWDQLFTADYYTINNCRNKVKYRTPRSGRSCAGIFVNTISIYLGKRYVAREYLIGKLSEPLIKNHKYSVSFNVKPSYTIDEVKKVYTTRNISLAFLSNKSDVLRYRNVNEEYLLDLNEDITNTTGEIFDSINYTKIEGCYKAKGGERIFVIGNFRHDTLSSLVPMSKESIYAKAYLLVDDIYVEEFKELPSIDNQRICQNDSLQLDVSSLKSNEIFINGQKIDNTGVITIYNSGNYHIENKLGTCVNYEWLEVNEVECENCQAYLPNIISANEDGINDEIEVKSNCDIELLSSSLYSRWGNLIWSSHSKNFNSHRLTSLPKGTYVVECKVLFKYSNQIRNVIRDITIN